jgi:hypothetical protein
MFIAGLRHLALCGWGNFSGKRRPGLGGCPFGRNQRFNPLVSLESESPRPELEVNSKISLEENMIRLHEQVGTQLRTFGRCAMIGTLIGLMTTQAFAASAPAVTPQPATLPETSSATSNFSTQAIDKTPTANLPLVAVEYSMTDANALPDAPNAPEEQASITKPLDIKGIMDDAAQNTQNLQPTTTTQQKHQVQPAWLVLTAIGGLGVAIGAMGLAKGSRKAAPLAGSFVGVGAGLAGLGLYLTFK